MTLRRLRRDWERAARKDPLFAILTLPDKRGRWDPGEFFAWGRDEIDGVLRYVESLSLPLRRARALDFGCGIGRVTQALALHFETVDGVDIAPTMIRLAETENRFGDRCHYHLNARADLGMFPAEAFDFVYSNITLQHMEPRFSAKYLLEFLRVLKKGGILLFQLPAEPLAVWPEIEIDPLSPSSRLSKRLARAVLPASIVKGYRRARYRMANRAFEKLEAHGIPKDDVVALVQGHGGRVVDVQPDPWQPRWRSFRYCVTKA